MRGCRCDAQVQVQNPDFAPYLQRARGANPEAIFVFIPGNQAGAFARQYAERGIGASGVKLIGTGDMTDDDLLNSMGDAAIGIVRRTNTPRRTSPRSTAFSPGQSPPPVSTPSRI